MQDIIFTFGFTLARIGATGFEPATTRPPDECATRLRHAPIHKKEALLLHDCTYENQPLHERLIYYHCQKIFFHDD